MNSFAKNQSYIIFTLDKAAAPIQDNFHKVTVTKKPKKTHTKKQQNKTNKQLEK